MATSPPGGPRPSPVSTNPVRAPEGTPASRSGSGLSGARTGPAFGRSVSAATPNATTTGAGVAGNSDSSVPVGDRNVQITTGDTPLSSQSANLSKGPLPLTLPDGSEVTLERIDDGGGPTDFDSRLGEILTKERNGDVEGEKKAFWEKAAGLASTALDFLMHNRKFQTGLGLIGIFACVGVGCVFPVALVAAGPFIIIFANGFIDNPMLTDIPQPPSQQNPAPENGDKPGSEPDPGAKPPSSGPDGDPKPPPPPNPPSLPQGDRSSLKEEDEEEIRDLAAEAADRASKKSGQPVSSFVPPPGVSQEEAMRIASGLGLDLQALKREQDEVFDFKLGQYLSSLEQENPEGDQPISKELRQRIENKVTREVMAEYQLDRNPLSMREPLSRREWKMVQNAVTKQVVDILAREGGADKLGWSSRRLIREAARELGVANLNDDRLERTAPINKYLTSRVRKTTYDWFRDKGLL